MKMRTALLMSLLVLLFMACDKIAAPPDSETKAPGEVPTESPVRESPLSPPATPSLAAPEETSPLPTPSPAATESRSADADLVIASAREYLARELNMELDRVRPVSIQVVDWPDAGLGCPLPGESYAQVVTPGYRIVLQVQGEEYELHTDLASATLRICERNEERPTSAAVAYLAQTLGLAEDEIEVVSVAAYEWPDASLGCPEPGRAYAQVITPGHRIRMEAEGETYEVRTDETGRTLILCEGNP